MQLSSDTRGADWDGSSRYHYRDSVIYGFSHSQLCGTGIPDGGRLPAWHESAGNPSRLLIDEVIVQ